MCFENQKWHSTQRQTSNYFRQDTYISSMSLAYGYYYWLRIKTDQDFCWLLKSWDRSGRPHTRDRKTFIFDAMHKYTKKPSDRNKWRLTFVLQRERLETTDMNESTVLLYLLMNVRRRSYCQVPPTTTVLDSRHQTLGVYIVGSRQCRKVFSPSD
jgi:hypothetical protein